VQTVWKNISLKNTTYRTYVKSAGVLAISSQLHRSFNALMGSRQVWRFKLKIEDETWLRGRTANLKRGARLECGEKVRLISQPWLSGRKIGKCLLLRRLLLLFRPGGGGALHCTRLEAEQGRQIENIESLFDKLSLSMDMKPWEGNIMIISGKSSSKSAPGKSETKEEEEEEEEEARCGCGGILMRKLVVRSTLVYFIWWEERGLELRLHHRYIFIMPSVRLRLCKT
jgi:hypothetical protein